MDSDTDEPLCGTCAFFGKLSLCPRRERYNGEKPCRLYKSKRKIEATSPLFPLLPDTRALRESKERIKGAIEGPSFLWWLVPFLFGILGGIVAYVAVKGDDPEMADRLLGFSIAWTVVLFIIGWIFLLH